MSDTTTPINDTPEVNPAEVQRALDPTTLEPYTLGDKTFHPAYLSIAAQNALDRLLKPWMDPRNVAGADAAELMERIKDTLPAAVTLILADQDPTVTEAWVNGLRGPGMRERLFQIVMQQVGIDELGKFYALLSLLSVKLLQRTSLTLSP